MKKQYLILPFVMVLVFGLWLLPDPHGNYPVPLGNFSALVFRESVSPNELKEKMRSDGLRILIVPGHDPVATGAQFGAVMEEKLTRELAAELAKQFKNYPMWEVMVARDTVTGQYQHELAEYFIREQEAINTFRVRLREQFLALISSGKVEAKVIVPHGFAKADVAHRLFGINKWSNENDVDIVLHIHFNDYPRKNLNKPGEYTGFSVYIPEKQYPNARASRAVGEHVFAALKKYLPVSTLPPESIGLIEDQELIALGANASLDKPSLLIEYGYIYEPKFKSPATRAAVFESMATQTINGLNSYFQ